MSDIRRVLARKVVEKIRVNLNEGNFIQGHTDRIVKMSRRCLTGSLYAFGNRFGRVLKAGKEGLEEKEGRRERYRERSAFFYGLRGDVEKLRGLVDEIQL
jgi:hypothetical protein